MYERTRARKLSEVTFFLSNSNDLSLAEVIRRRKQMTTHLWAYSHAEKRCYSCVGRIGIWSFCTYKTWPWLPTCTAGIDCLCPSIKQLLCLWRCPLVLHFSITWGNRCMASPTKPLYSAQNSWISPTPGSFLSSSPQENYLEVQHYQSRQESAISQIKVIMR